MDNNVIELAFENITNEMVCPFRSESYVDVRMSESGTAIQFQRTIYPPCQYGLCPFYNHEGRTNNERCTRADISISI